MKQLIVLIAMVATASMSHAAQDRLHFQEPATKVRVVEKAGQREYQNIPSPGNNYDEINYAIKIGALDGTAYLDVRAQLSPEPDDRVIAPYVRLLDTNGVEFAMLPLSNGVLWCSGGVLSGSMRLPALPQEFLIACGYAYYCDMTYAHMQGGPQETVVDAGTGSIVRRGHAQNRDAYAVEMSHPSGLLFLGETMHARLASHQMPKNTNEVDRIDVSYVIYNLDMGREVRRQDDVTDVVFMPKVPGNYLVVMKVGPASQAYWRWVRHVVVLPKIEMTDDPAHLGEIAVNDSISFGQLNDVHKIDDGRVDLMLGEEGPSDRLPGSQQTNMWAAPGRVVTYDRGFFGCALGMNMKWNMPYLLELEYPEDQPRSFAFVVGNEAYTPGIAVGHTMGQPAPRFFAEQTIFPLSQRIMKARFVVWAGDEEVRNGIYFGVADPGRRNDPFSRKPLLFSATLYQFTSIAKMRQRVSFPPEFRRHVWVEQDGMGLADNVRFAPHVNALMYGLNALAPAVLFWNGHGEHNISLMFPTARYQQPLRQVVGNREIEMDKMEDPAQRYNLIGESCAWARQMDLAVFPRFDYGGSDLVPASARAIGKDGAPYPFSHRRVADAGLPESVDICNTAVLADATAVVADFLAAVGEEDRSVLRRLVFRQRGNFLATSYADATIALFERETTNRLEGASAAERRANLVARHDAAYRRWYQLKLFAFLQAVNQTYQQALVMPVTPCLYYHWRQPGMPYEGLYYQTAEAWEQSWSGIRRMPFEGFPLPVLRPASLVASVSRSTSMEDGLYPELVPQKDIRAVIPVYGQFAASCAPYYDAFRQRLSTVKIVPTLEPGAYMYRGSRRIVAAGQTFYRSRQYSMYEPLLAFCTGNPIEFAFDQSHPACFPFPEYTRRFFANFLALPAVPMMEVPQPGGGEKLVVKTAQFGSAIYVAVANPSFGAVEAKVLLPGMKASTLRPLVGPEKAEAFFVGAQGISFNVTMDSMELRSFRLEP